MSRRALARLFALLALSLLAACAPPEPVRIGYVSTLNGRSADLGMEGRNGTLLAIEEANAAGGIHGRRLELLVRDDGLNPEQAVRAIEELAAERVEAIVGPMLSHMALMMAPVATRLQVVLASPTATADELLGRDDYLFRFSSPTSTHAKLDATFQLQSQKRRRIAIAYETTNKTYVEGYLREFDKVFTGLGGEITRVIAFDTARSPDFAAIVGELRGSRPDALLFIANAVDTARLAQHARRQMPEMPLVGVAWAGSVDLIQLGGAAVEGMHVSQYFNRDDRTPTYVAFREAYHRRFREYPGFGSTAAYDATRTLIDALRRKPAGMTLREALLTLGPFPGVQRPVEFDRFGDAARPSFITVVRKQQLEVIPWP